MHFRFGQRNTDAQDASPAVVKHSDRNQDRAVAYAAAVAHFLVAGIQNKVGRSCQWSVAPRLQFFVEQPGGAAHLAAAHVQAAQFLRDFRHLSGGHPLDIHLGHGQLQRPFATLPSLERGGVKLDVPRLGHLQIQASEATVDRLGLEAVGIAPPRLAALVGHRPQGVGPLELHRLVHQDLDRFGHSVEPVLAEQLEQFLETGRMIVVGHGDLLSHE